MNGTPWPTSECKKPCGYLDAHGICNYYLDTGIRRPCPCGPGCTVRVAKRRQEPGEQPPQKSAPTKKATRRPKWDTDRAVAMRKEGQSWRQIEEALGQKPETVRTWMRSHHPELCGAKACAGAPTTWDTEAGKAMWLAGARASEIARALGASDAAVWDYAKRHWPERDKPAPWYAAEAKARFDKGERLAQIARALGIKGRALSKYASTHGWTKMTGGPGK